MLNSLKVNFRFNYKTAVPQGDWLGVVPWGEDPAPDSCIVTEPFPAASEGKVRPCSL